MFVAKPARTGKADTNAGQVGRRRTLPNGRAVVGGFAVAAAAVLVFAAFLTTQSRTGRAWVVAEASLPAGTTITAPDLTTKTFDLGTSAAAADAFASPAEAIGHTLAVAVAPGELVLRSELDAPGTTPSLRPVPVTIAPNDLVDLTPGDLVDVLETTGSNSSGRTTIVLRGARVIDTSQPSGGLVDSGGDDVVTIGVHSLAEVVTVIGAEHDGTVDLVVGEPADGTGQGS
jgi:Flp pilus assembly protein CpaB